MTPTMARRLGKATALLGSPQDGEVIAAVRAIGRTLEGASMDWNAFASMVATSAARRSAPAFTFANVTPRAARKLMAHMARHQAASVSDRARLEQLRQRLLGIKKLMLSAEEIGWLDGLWRSQQSEC